MRKYLFIISVVLFSCKAKEEIKRITLPMNSESRIEYSESIEYDGEKREQIYDKINQWAVVKFPSKNIQQQSKSDGIITLLGREQYLYSGKESFVGYKMILIIEDGLCRVVIKDINIRHRNAELYYKRYDDGNGKNVKLGETFKSMDNSIWKVINEIPR